MQVQEALGHDPHSGHLYAFWGKLGDLPKTGSAPPRSVVDARTYVWLAECWIAIFEILNVDRTERRPRLLQGRKSLNLNELILEIAARKGGDDLVALLLRIVIISYSDNVHYDTRVC